MTLETRFTQLFGCTYPIQQAGMGGFTNPDLAIAVSDAGGLGMLSAVLPLPQLRAQLDAIAEDAHVGVNFLMPFFDERIFAEVAGRTRYVEFFWAPPDTRLTDIAHEFGALAGWQVGSANEARAAHDAGCDIVIVQGIEAGGHLRGSAGLLALLDEVRDVIDTPLVAAGGIGTGRAMADALTAGADAVRIGTRFLAARESVAHPDYVDALIRASAEDTVMTTAFGDGWPDAPHRVLASCVDAGMARGRAQSWSPSWPTHDDEGPIASRALYAGQSVAAVHARQPAAEIVAELVRDAERALTAGR